MMWVFLAACTDGKTGDDSDLGIHGTVSAERMGDPTVTVSGELSTGKAFGVNTAGEMILLVTPNPEVTCADAAAYLTGPDEDWNPEIIIPGGTCSLFIRADFDGTPLDIVDDPIAATVVVSCAMGEGEWVKEDHEGDVGYYWSGGWWFGSPQGFSLTVEGGEGEDYALSIDMDEYAGSFSYDVAYPDPDPASGAVSGATTAAWCPDLGPGLGR